MADSLIFLLLFLSDSTSGGGTQMGSSIVIYADYSDIRCLSWIDIFLERFWGETARHIETRSREESINNVNFLDN